MSVHSYVNSNGPQAKAELVTAMSQPYVNLDE